MPAFKSSRTLNLALKVAILQYGTQRRVSIAADIGEVRLSKIVRGAPATADEKRALARTLGRPQRELFPSSLELHV